MNGVIRIIVRLVMLNGVRHGIDWFFNRRAQKAAEDLPPEEARKLREQSKKNARSTKRSMNILRRFTRF